MIKSKISLVVLFLFVLVFVATGVYFYEKSQASTLGPAVFLLPHQDDEMFLAGAIRQHVISGRNVHVVMVTDGRSTGAINKINNKLTQEGRTSITQKHLVSARDKEFTSSMLSLGVKYSNIHFANKDIGPYYVDGQLTKSKAKEVINYYYNRLGNGSYKTVSVGIGSPNSNYSHNDHKALFLALRETTKISDQRYYNDKELPGVTRRDNITNYSFNLKVHNTQVNKRKALDSYSVWSPSSGRYSVGEFSVGSLIRTWQDNPYEYVIKRENALTMTVQ
jgi:hypothetical protein